MTTIGFIGLGHMGQPMAKHLLAIDPKLCVYDVEPKAVQALMQEGATAQSIVEMAKAVDIVFTSVQTGEQVKSICLGETGLFAHAKSNLLYIDCSSIDITTTLLLHTEAQQREIAMLDAPVSGGVSAAQAGTLTIMVGGDDKNFERARMVLDKLAKKVIHAGPAGRGQAAKICNNLLLGISMVGVCEAFALAEKLGLDPKKFFEISSNASGQCWAMTSYCPVPGIIEKVPANHQYEPGFTARMMLKDLRLAHHAAETVEASIPLGAVTAELYELYINQGAGSKDFSGIIEMIASKAFV